VEGSCGHGNELSGSIKCWEVLEWLHNWQLLKKGYRVGENAVHGK
jgi:predicted deacylase